VETKTLHGQIVFRVIRYDEQRKQMLIALTIEEEGEETNVILADDLPATNWHDKDSIIATGTPRINQYGHAELMEAQIAIAP